MKATEPITILCYGDSNTWGKDPAANQRYPFADRWPNILAQNLGDNYHVIAEGELGRTIIFDDEDPSVPCRNGYTLLTPLLDSHRPDYLVVMLGTNDTRFFNNASPTEIAEHYVHYLRACQEYHCRMIIVAPQPASDGFINPATGLSANKCFNEDSFHKMQKLPDAMRKFAAEHNVDFIDPTDFAAVGPDHLHWTKDTHRQFADKLTAYFKNLA